MTGHYFVLQKQKQQLGHGVFVSNINPMLDLIVERNSSGHLNWIVDD